MTMITFKHHVPFFVWLGLCGWGGHYNEYLGMGLFVAGVLLVQMLNKKE
jgi:hypothetical protein